MKSDRPNNATPAAERCVTSYPVRRSYRPGVVFPPAIPGVEGTIDIHAHAHEGQQDALALAQVASESKMRGIVFKTIGPLSGEYRPGRIVAQLNEELRRWAERHAIPPITCWAGYGVTMDNRPPSIERLRLNLADGVVAVWLPVFNHANTLHKVGGKPIWWDPSADPDAHTGPLPWELALKYGYYMLDERHHLKPEYAEAIRIVADSGAALFFGHATHAEIWALADFCDNLGFRRAVIDHPFSPFIDLTVDEMKELVNRGVYLNFTYDELSPLLGIDPAKMYAAIRTVGVEHCTLSSDAGEPLFPHSVECIRLVRAYMEAFGMNQTELAAMCIENPARIVGLAPVAA